MIFFFFFSSCLPWSTGESRAGWRINKPWAPWGTYRARPGTADSPDKPPPHELWSCILRGDEQLLILVRFCPALKWKQSLASSLVWYVKTWLAALELHCDSYRNAAACLEEATYSVRPQVKFLANCAVNHKLDSVGSEIWEEFPRVLQSVPALWKVRATAGSPTAARSLIFHCTVEGSFIALVEKVTFFELWLHGYDALQVQAESRCCTFKGQWCLAFDVIWGWKL